MKKDEPWSDLEKGTLLGAVKAMLRALGEQVLVRKGTKGWARGPEEAGLSACVCEELKGGQGG